MKIENFQSQVCVCAASTNLICAKSRAEMEKKMTEEYTALDLETTGLNPKKDKIIEIGAV